MSDAAANYTERLHWFHEARFGLFIHWGPYAVLGQGEWAMFTQRIPVREYARLARRFTAKKFDADAWARMAVDAGMKYAVLTARHHDGFCLYDSKASDFTSVKIGAKRDLVAEYVAACRKAGLKVGLYYSLLDWRFPGNFEPAKFPESSRAMVEQAHAQMRELMTNYGKIDVVWYDGGYVYNGMTSRADMAPFWRAVEINAMVRQLQPGIIINNRIGLDEDIDTPEQHVKASAPGRAWESCMTMHDSGWGYVRNSPAMQTAPQLLGHLVTAAAGEGNFLLNVGPKPDGTIRKEERERLAVIGRWMAVNGEAVYGSERCALGAPDGHWTRKGTVGYLIVRRWPAREVMVPMVKTPAESAELLGAEAALKMSTGKNGRLLISGLPKKPPVPPFGVIKVRFAEAPEKREEPDRAAFLKGKA